MKRPTEPSESADEKVARLNALAVLQRMEEMQKKLDSYHEALVQMGRRINEIQGQMTLQQTLANQIAAHGRGPTV